MKSDRTRPMTPRIARRLGELGIALPPETTIHEANRILSQALQPKKGAPTTDEVIANIKRILEEAIECGVAVPLVSDRTGANQSEG